MFDSQDSKVCRDMYKGYYMQLQQQEQLQHSDSPASLRMTSPMFPMSMRSIIGTPARDASQPYNPSGLNTPRMNTPLLSSGYYSGNLSNFMTSPVDSGAPGGSAELFQRESAARAAAYMQEYSNNVFHTDFPRQSSQTSLPPVSVTTSQPDRVSPMVGDSMRVSRDDPEIVKIDSSKPPNTSDPTDSTQDKSDNK